VDVQPKWKDGTWEKWMEYAGKQYGEHVSNLSM
jgi:hypothetical protein